MARTFKDRHDEPTTTTALAGFQTKPKDRNFLQRHIRWGMRRYMQAMSRHDVDAMATHFAAVDRSSSRLNRFREFD